jgi:hypothetical protein
VNDRPYLIAQQSQPSVPSTSAFADVVLWDYSFSFHYEGDVTFSIAYNEGHSIAYSMTIVDGGGIGEIHVTAESGPSPLITIPRLSTIPAAGGYRFQDEEGAFLTAEQLLEAAGTRTVTIPRLSIVNAQSATATIQQVSFLEPLLPLLTYDQQFDVTPAGTTLAEQLTSILNAVLGRETFPPQPLSLECYYAYTIGGMPVVVPVVLVPRQDFAVTTDAAIISEIAGSIEQWMETVQPPATDARIALKLTLWNALLDQKATLLQANLSFALHADVI